MTETTLDPHGCYFCHTTRDQHPQLSNEGPAHTFIMPPLKVIKERQKAMPPCSEPS